MTLFRFNLFKSDIGTRNQFEACGIWLKFSRFSIAAQQMYLCTTRDVHCYLWLQEKRHCKMSVHQVWRFMHRILKVLWRRMLYLGLPIYSLGRCIRYANIKVFSEPHFPKYRQNPRTCTQKYVSEKPVHSDILTSLAYFTY